MSSRRNDNEQTEKAQGEIAEEYDASDERPPVFKSWTAWYALVLVAFAIIVALMSWFSVAF
jgi:hypothetical protein